MSTAECPVNRCCKGRPSAGSPVFLTSRFSMYLTSSLTWLRIFLQHSALCRILSFSSWSSMERDIGEGRGSGNSLKTWGMPSLCGRCSVLYFSVYTGISQFTVTSFGLVFAKKRILSIIKSLSGGYTDIVALLERVYSVYRRIA